MPCTLAPTGSRCCASHILLHRDWFTAVGQGVPDGAVVHRHLTDRLALAATALTAAEPPEGHTELLGHEVVDDGIDGTVAVDAHAAEEQHPGVGAGGVRH